MTDWVCSVKGCEAHLDEFASIARCGNGDGSTGCLSYGCGLLFCDDHFFDHSDACIAAADASDAFDDVDPFLALSLDFDYVDQFGESLAAL